jgi:hypothetical protein
MTNNPSLVEQAQALLSDMPAGLAGFARIDLANALLQLEQANQLRRIADRLDCIDKTLRRL